MGACCNVRTLSYISALVQLVAAVVLLFAAVFFGAVNANKLNEFGSFLSLSASFGVVLLVALLIGINQNHTALVGMYIYCMSLCLLISNISIIINFVKSIPYNPIDKVIVDLILNMTAVGFNLIFIVPIYMFYQEMRGSTIQPKIHGKEINVQNVPKSVQKKNKKKKVVPKKKKINRSR